MVFKCRNCGGNSVYNPEKGTMYCPHCESLDSDERVDSQSITECSNCGAPIEIGKFESSNKCPYCGMYLIFNERVEEKYKPKWVLPFKISKNKAIEIMHDKFKKKTFIPSGFLSAATLESMEGKYVPFWLYDFETNYKYRGTGTKVRTWRSGDVEYTETSFYDVVRDMDIDFYKVPVDASILMEDGIMDLMEPYQYEESKEFEEKYMSGFLGEVYNMEAGELIQRAKDKSSKDAETLVERTINGYTGVVPTDRGFYFKNEDASYALLPVWQYVYNYKGKQYTYHVNGQTGKLVGEVPVAVNKVVGYSATVFALVLLAGNFIQMIVEVFS